VGGGRIARHVQNMRATRWTVIDVQARPTSADRPTADVREAGTELPGPSRRMLRSRTESMHGSL
jgi:hypothetical protein